MPSLVTLKRHAKTKILQFHAPVPADVQAAAKKKTHTASLGVRSTKEAMPLYEREKARFDTWIESLRSGPQRLTQKQIEALAGQWYAAAEQSLSDDPHELKRWSEVFGFLDPRVRLLIKPKWGRATLAVSRAADRLAEDLVLNLNDESRARLEVAIHRKLPALEAMLSRRLAGDYSEDPTLKQFPKWEQPLPKGAPKGSSVGLTFELMIQRWKAAEPDRSVDTVKGVERMVGEFAAFVGHGDPSRVSTDDVMRWRDSLMAKGLKTPTINRKYLAALRSHGHRRV